MKNVLCLLVILLFLTTNCFAAINDMGGFAWTPVTQNYEVNALATTTGQVVWTPASGKKIVLLGVSYSSSPASQFILETDVEYTGASVLSSTIVVPTTNCLTSGQVVIGNGTPIWRGDADDKLYLGITVAPTGETHPQSILLWGYESN